MTGYQSLCFQVMMRFPSLLPLRNSKQYFDSDIFQMPRYATATVEGMLNIIHGEAFNLITSI